jgi:transposase InsO family protein
VKYRFIARHAPKFPVRGMCRVLGVSASGYYRWRVRQESQRSREDRRLRVQIRTIHRETKGRYGSPRIHQELRARGVRCSRKRVARLMREERLQGRHRRRYRVTTQSVHRHAVAPNRLNRQFRVAGANQVWAGDITYLWTEEGWLYLAVLLDLFSRRVVGWAVSARINGELTLSALQMALDRCRPGRGLLHHSDRGSQYAAGLYQARLRRQGLEVSMSRAGDCFDNAVVESFFSTLKLELEGMGRYRTREEAYQGLFDYIERFYNCRRRHSALGYFSPAEFEKAQQKRNSKSNGLRRYPAVAACP